MLTADWSNRKKKKLEKKERKVKTTKNLPGLLKYNPAVKTLFRICTENYNYRCVSPKYPSWKEINIDIFRTNRTPLISPNLHIILFRERKPDASRTEKKTLLIKIQLHWRTCSLHPVFRRRIVNKSPEKTAHWHQYCYSQVTFFSLKQFRGSQLHPRLPPLWLLSAALKQHKKCWRHRGYAKIFHYGHHTSAI